MATVQELVRHYARQLRAAATEQRTSLAKTASVGSPIHRAVGAVLLDLAGYEPEGQALVLSALDRELVLPTGRMEWVKKGSVENLLQYEQMLMQLLSEIEDA